MAGIGHRGHRQRIAVGIGVVGEHVDDDGVVFIDGCDVVEGHGRLVEGCRGEREGSGIRRSAVGEQEARLAGPAGNDLQLEMVARGNRVFDVGPCDRVLGPVSARAPRIGTVLLDRDGRAAGSGLVAVKESDTHGSCAIGGKAIRRAEERERHRTVQCEGSLGHAPPLIARRIGLRDTLERRRGEHDPRERIPARVVVPKRPLGGWRLAERCKRNTVSDEIQRLGSRKRGDPGHCAQEKAESHGESTESGRATIAARRRRRHVASSGSPTTSWFSWSAYPTGESGTRTVNRVSSPTRS